MRGYKRKRGMWLASGVVLASGLLAAPAGAAAETGESPARSVPGCETGCETVFSLSLPNDVSFEGLRPSDPASGLNTLLAYSAGGQLRAVDEVTGSDGRPYDAILSAACGFAGDAQRCSVGYGYGAHSGAVASVLLTWDRGIEVTSFAEGGAGPVGTPDLDGDGAPDAVVKQSTGIPDHASAPQFWQTFVERDGLFVSTGCTEPATGPQDEPAAPATGTCVLTG